MKKVLIVFFLTFGIFLTRPKVSFAYTTCSASQQTNCCESTSTNSCVPSLGECITGGGIYCCSDQTTCLGIDNQAAWVPGQSGPTSTDNCKFQLTGDCTDPSLPQACLFSMSYYCCNTAQACIDEYGGSAPVPKANPSQPVATSVPNSVLCSNGTGINTAIGCLDVLGPIETFLGEVLKWAIGIGAGVTFLMIIYSGFLIMTATGDPKRMQAGKELLTSAISGLVLIVLSIFVLNVVGVEILGLCKFGFGPAC